MQFLQVAHHGHVGQCKVEITSISDQGTTACFAGRVSFFSMSCVKGAHVVNTTKKSCEAAVAENTIRLYGAEIWSPVESLVSGVLGLRILSHLVQ